MGSTVDMTKLHDSLKKSFSIYFKILMNYLQMLSLIYSLNLQWPFYVSKYFNIASQFSPNADVISFDCVIEDYEIKEKPIHVKTFVIGLFPFFVFAILSLVFCLLKFFTNKSQKHKYFIGFIIVGIFLQPILLQVLFDNLNYRNLDDGPYLKKELMLRIDDENHIKWVNNQFFKLKFQ